MWITVDVERVLRVDRGINVILCNPMLGSGGPQTLVLKLKGSEMETPEERAVIPKRTMQGSNETFADQVSASPIARAHITAEDDGPYVRLEVLDGELLQPSMSPVDLYARPAARVVP